MLIALPNADKSFTATLFAPYKGQGGFDAINASDIKAIMAYFDQYFPEVAPLMPQLASDFQQNPVGSLVTIRVSPWNIGRVVLIGDAAHAVVPFYGQGMNAAFEDCLQLYSTLREDQRLGVPLENTLCSFSSARSLATNTLADLCLEHYHDMASNTMSSLYLLRKKLEAFLHFLFPASFTPLYSMVVFSLIPYDRAVAKAKAQDIVISRVMKVSAILLTALMGLFTANLLRGRNSFLASR